MLTSGRSRVNVAAQACETCRRRKSRCDELRPKCSLCQRLNVECRYREQSPPNRREDSFARMQETLERLEEKIDSISVGGTRPPSMGRFSVAPSSSQQTPASVRSDPEEGASVQRLALTSDLPQDTPPYFAAPHRTVVWPTIYSELTRYAPQASGRLAALSEGGTSWLLAQEMADYQARMPIEIDLPAVTAQTERGYPSFSSRTFFPTLTVDRLRLYASAYFTTFNVAYPILEEAMFMNETMQPILADGFRYGDAGSVLALFVLALGQLAIDSLTGEPIQIVDGSPSGICGGSAAHPPGLDIFNEGRARIGSLVLRGDVISVQVLLLQGTYFEANGCHVEYWRSITEASMVCQLLAQSLSAPWASLNGDLLRRAFWTCLIDANFYHLDLDLPGTDVSNLADKIRYPNFTKATGNSGWSGGSKAQSLMEFFFVSKISLLKVVMGIHQAIQHYSSDFENLRDYSGPPLHVIRELTRQLDEWRTGLPSALQWSDDALSVVPEEDPTAARPVDYTSGMSALGGNTHLTRAGAEMLAVELRARFYYSRFMLGRPFIFKALHFSELMNPQDIDHCIAAVHAACLLPAALAPLRHKKRLLPHLFTWTQSFIALLTILWVSQRNDYLGRICSERLDAKWIEAVIQEMLHWIRDIKQIDGIAEWSWHFLQPLYEQDAEVSGQ